LLFVLPVVSPPIAFAQSRPAVGGVVSPPDALLVYEARGAAGACGENCSEWVAAEGTLYWDAYKRMIAGLDRLGTRRPLVVLDFHGPSGFLAAMSIGRLLRERGFAVTVGRTLVDDCRDASTADCEARKRAGAPLNASLSESATCDTACVLSLAGGVRRTVPAATAVIIGGWRIRSPRGLNIADEHREGLHAHAHDQYKVYLTQMGVDAQVAEIMEGNYERQTNTVLSPADLVQLRIVTSR
jgi:hypothetical protein